MKRVKKILKGHCWRKAVIYFLTWCLVLNTSLPVVLATPSGGVFTVGTGSIDYGTNTAVTVNQSQSVIQWGAPGSGGIDTSATESLTFLQAGGLSNSAVLNRIMSGSPTQFDGALSGADMRIFIVNPAGIVFGSGSTVNVSQLVASGLNMSDADFISATGPSATQFRFEGGNGQVTNRGGITANSVYLIGKKVTNNSGITARNGLIVMAAGDNVYLAQDGSEVLVEVAGVGDGTPDVDNRSLLYAPNGDIVLAAGDTFSRAIRNAGWIVASSGTITARAARIENRAVIRTDANPAADGDGGTVTLTGIESLLVGADGGGIPGSVEADGSGNGNGGSITLETEGTLTVAEGTLISARGGSLTGDGGSVKITAEHFTIAGQIDASPGNTDYNPGTLEIDPAIVTIANGENLGAIDTLYEQDIETWSNNGTSLVVYADEAITIEDIEDGRIAGRYGDIELHATAAESFISFLDTADKISTTLGDIKMSAGSGGLTIGSLETGDIGLEASPGQIALSTHSAGDITTESLTIKGGQGHAEINVTASGNLTVNGDVVVGRDSAIHNIPLGQDAEAFIYLKAGDNIVLNGDVRADSHGIHEAAEDSVTKSYIGIFSGTHEPVFGDATINGNLVATAKSANLGTSEATIEIDAWGALTWGPEAADPVADADEGQVHIASKESAEQTSEEGDIARVIVKVEGHVPVPRAMPDLAETHMGTPVQGNVLENDLSPAGEPLTATLVTGPTQAVSFTLNANGSYSYTSKPGYVGTDTFTYTASAEGATSDPVTVTITMTNTPPLAEGEARAMHMGEFTIGTVDVSDPDGDPFTIALVTTTEHGALMFYSDGDYLYQPDPGYVGPDSFTFSAVDNQIDAEPVLSTVSLTVTNTQPLVEGEAITTHMGAAVKGTIADNIVDPEGDPFTVGLVATTQHGTLKVNGDGTYTYQPNAGYIGEDAFTFSAWDEQIDAVPVEAVVTFTITNTGPTGTVDSAVTTHARPVVINVLHNDLDPDKDPLSVASYSYTGVGKLVLNADGTFTYTPPSGFLGKESFTYSATDGQIGAELTETTVIISVNIGRLPPPEYFMPTGPDLAKTDVKASGCPALTQWAARELGLDQRKLDVWMVNGLASGRGIQPCDACGTLRRAATILSDTKGAHVTALAEVISEFTSSALPPSEEQMASIADAIASRSRTGNRYALAGEYLAALSDYVTTLNSEIGFSAESAVKFVSERYINRLARSGNTAVAAYATARLDELSVFLSLSQLAPVPATERPIWQPALDFDMMR